MPRTATVPRSRSVCQICDLIAAQRPFLLAESALSARYVSRMEPQIRRSFKTLMLSDRRTITPTRTPIGRRGNAIAAAGDAGAKQSHASARKAKPSGQELSSVTNMMTYIENATSKVVAHRGIPSEADVAAALQSCRVVVDYIMDDSVQPQINHMITELNATTASSLLSLDSTKVPLGLTGSDPSDVRISAQLRQMIDKVSATTYAILAHPTVFITPSLLQQYVGVQSRLGRPESLPKAFQLYASKPLPRAGSGSAGSPSFVNQNPDKAANAINPEVVEKALDTAIEAKNLDAAVGIIENSYAAKAFTRNKLVRQALLPLGAIAATPVAAYALATNISGLQQTMDSATATNVAFAGILAYVGFTASIGIVALTSANDQMRRVTWAPGIPLRTRWIREEERSALDKIACAWGFREPWRQGEEEGAEWDVLREYIGQRGMVLDRTELMEGME